MQVIVTRKDADFDALASLITLKTFYPRAAALLPQGMQPAVERYYAQHREQLTLAEAAPLEKIELLILADVSRQQALGEYAALVSRADKIIVYDHRPPAEGSLFSGEGRVGEAGATATLLVEETIQRHSEVTPVTAQLLALGICQKTGFLTFGTATSRDVQALAWLWDQGVEPRNLQNYLLPPLQEDLVRDLETALAATRVYNINDCQVNISAWESREFFSGYQAVVGRMDKLREADVRIYLVRLQEGVYLEARSRKADLRQALQGFPLQGSSRLVTALLPATGLEAAGTRVLESLRRGLKPLQLVEEEMSSPVHTLEPETTIATARDRFTLLGHNGFPVVAGKQLAGILCRKELETALRHYPGTTAVGDIMTGELETVQPRDSLYRAWHKMLTAAVGRLPVVTAQGELVGIITRSDIMRRLYPLRQKDVAGPATSPPGITNLIPVINTRLPAQAVSLLLLISRESEQLGYELYAVGGMVRDLLLGRKIEDLDILVVGDALALAARIQSLLGGQLKSNPELGTASLATVAWRIDFAASRQDFYLYSGKTPQVQGAAISKDLGRRDFTINAMACSLNRKDFGLLIDPFQGCRDLQQGLIRVLYNLSFADDPLRILRAARLAERLKFSLETETEGFLQMALKAHSLVRVSRERLGDELQQIFREEEPDNQIRRLSEMGVWQWVLPPLEQGEAFWDKMAAVRREWQRKATPADSPEVYYLAALWLSRPRGGETADRSFNFSRRQREKLKEILGRYEKIIVQLRSNASPAQIAEMLEGYPREGRILISALAGEAAVLLQQAEKLLPLQPALNGHDLKSMGIEPGPEMGRILEALKTARREGIVSGREDELQFVQAFIQGKETE